MRQGVVLWEGKVRPADSGAEPGDVGPDAPDSASSDAARGSEIAGGASDADAGDGGGGFDVDVSGPEVTDAGNDDIHVTVQPPSSNRGCACWPDGDDCDKFFNNVRWAYKEYPPCPENEVCTGDYFHSGTCQAKCGKPKPGQEVRFECHPTEKCKTIEMFD